MISEASHKNNVIRIAVVTAAILAIPLIAMQFSDDVDWGLFDLIIIGTLIFGTGMIYEFGVKKLRTTTHQMIAITILVVVLLLTWAELAVGVFGTPFAGS